MSKLNEGKRLITAPMKTEKISTVRTHGGGLGFKREAQTELFMRATTVFAGEGSFYESAETADARSVELIRDLAVTDWEWVCGFLPWLRGPGNIRTSPIMLAAQAAHARAEKGLHGGQPLTSRQVVDQVLQRGDEPTEMVQYCLKTWGKLPMAVRRGVADAMVRLWGERAVIRNDKPDRPMRFADAIELVHPKVKVPAQVITARMSEASSAQEIVDFTSKWIADRNLLFTHLLNERHHPTGEVPEGLKAIAARRELSQASFAARHAMAAAALENRDGSSNRIIRNAAAGQWEWVTSWLGEGAQSATGLSEAAERAFTPLTERQRWELVIPWMGYMALLRNLRNFDAAGLKESMVHKVSQKLSDPAEVAMSRQLPFRFLSAWLNVPSVRWGSAIEQGLQASIPNVPTLDGHTLILIDTSGSMTNLLSVPPSKKKPSWVSARHETGKPEPKRPTRVMAAALFALALALKNPGKVDVFGFADGNFRVDNIQAGASLLRTAEFFCTAVNRVGSGTALEQNLRQTFDSSRHTRIAIFTDEQAIPGGPGWDSYRAKWIGIGDITSAVPSSVPVYSWNLAGYSNAGMKTGTNRVALAGLTDASFGIMSRLEQGRNAKWPWQEQVQPRPQVTDDDE